MCVGDVRLEVMVGGMGSWRKGGVRRRGEEVAWGSPIPRGAILDACVEDGGESNNA
jgi:hypothetical protein